jgi:hypothetical protein
VRTRQPKRGTFTALALAVLGLALAVSPAAWASGGRHGGAKEVTCSGPGSLPGYFELADNSEVKAKRAECGTAKRVVKKFAATCFKAYAGQTDCKLRVGKRWRCRSRMIRSDDPGLPSREKCRRHRSRVVFGVAYYPPSEPHDIGNVRPVSNSPFDETFKCIDLKPSGTVIPHPNPSSLGNFEIHVLDGPVSVGQDLQAALVAHGVSAMLHAGLGSQPRSNPDPIPIFVTNKNFDAAKNLGVTTRTCAYPNEDAIVVRTNLKPTDPPLAATAAHELFHAYAFWGINRGTVSVPWWEEASASWLEAKSGFPEEFRWNGWLQKPNYEALDYVPGNPNDPGQSWQYGMWRFVQFLDDRGLIGGMPAWPLQREVIRGYEVPGATFALFQGIPKQNSSTSLGVQLAAFWGDRLKAKPLHGPQLVPTAANIAGGKPIEITPDVSKIPTTAERLHTKLFDFKLTNEVQRVTFEFDPPDDGYFWGLTKPDESERFRKDDSVTFCVGGSDDPDMLKWPGHFPVTFTNGSLSTGEIKGEITVRGSKDAGQCQPPTPDNRACQILADARVSELLGPGSFPFHNESRDSDQVLWVCFYHGDQGEVNLNLARNLRASAREVRKGVKKQIEQLGLEPLDGVGDLAGIGTFTDDDGKNYGVVAMAVGKENALFIIGPGAQRQNAKTLAKRIAGQID